MDKKTKNKKEIQLSMDMILKMTPEVFRDTMKAQPMGFKLSLQNLLKAQYEQCSMSKDAILLNLEKGAYPEQAKEQAQKTIEDLYICMQLIEDRHTVLALLVEDTKKAN